MEFVLDHFRVMRALRRVNLSGHRFTIGRLVLLVAVTISSTAAVFSQYLPQPPGYPREVILRPGQNVQSQLDAAPAGSVIRFTSGVYHLAAPLVPKADQVLVGDGTAILSGAKELTGFIRDRNRWVVDRQSQEGQVLGEGSVCLPAAPRCARPEDLFIDDVPLRQASTLTDLQRGWWFFDYGQDRIYLADDPTGRRVETSVTPFAIGGYANNVTVRDLVIEKFASPTHEAAVNGLGRKWQLERLEVRLNHFAGIRTVDGASARSNRVHHNGALGFIGAGDDVLIEGNEIAFNNVAGYDPRWAAGGAKWVYTQRLTVRNNYSHDNHGPGLWTDIDNVDVLFESNRVEDNDLSGIMHEIGYRATIRNNTLSRNGRGKPDPGWVDGAGILVVSSSDVEVYGNTLVDNWQGISGLEAERGAGSRGRWVLSRLYVHDNVLWQTKPVEPGSGRSGIIQVDQHTTAFNAGADNRFERNTYHVGSTPRPFVWMNRDLTPDEWRWYQQDVEGTIGR